MAALALYRAWRPARFSDVVGQDAVVTTLKNQVASGRAAHAYLFCGSRGTGKTTCAKIFARAVNCETPEDGDPCGHCAACQALSAENNLDIIEIDAASNNGVDEIRDLRDKIKYPPQHGRYRVYIIDEVHMLSTGAFNALLKTLEEPPEHALFILATTEPQRLPATVLSRCQRYDFRRFPVQVIVDRLRTVTAGENADVSDEAYALIARAAEGGMRDALSLLDMCLAYGGNSVDAALVREVLGAADKGFLFAFAGNLLEGDAGGAMRAIDQLMRGGREPQVFARDVTGHLRALLLAESCGDALAGLLETTEEDAASYREQAAGTTRERLLSLLDLFIALETDMRWSGQPRVALEVAAARACLPEDALRLEAMAARLELLEKRVERGVLPAGGAGSNAGNPAKGSTAADMPPWDVPGAGAGNAAAGAPARASRPSARPAQVPASDDFWEAALKLIKKEAYLYAPVAQGKFAGMDGDAARLMYQKGREVFIDMLRRDGRQEKIEAMLSEAAGRPVTLRLEMEGAAPVPGEGARQQSVLDGVFEAFGRENVEVVDDKTE